MTRSLFHIASYARLSRMVIPPEGRSHTHAHTRTLTHTRRHPFTALCMPFVMHLRELKKRRGFLSLQPLSSSYSSRFTLARGIFSLLGLVVKRLIDFLRGRREISERPLACSLFFGPPLFSAAFCENERAQRRMCGKSSFL